MFVRRKTVHGNTYYQLVQNYREAGKHKQKVLCHLGRHKSLEAAIAAERKLAEDHENLAADWSEAAQIIKEEMEEILFQEYGQEVGDVVPSLQRAYLRWRAFQKEYRQKYLEPYDRWLYSRLPGERIDMGSLMEEYHLLLEKHSKRLMAEREEWEKQRQQWVDREIIEEELRSLVRDYHEAVDECRLHERRAAFHRTELNKFLEAKQKYCS